MANRMAIDRGHRSLHAAEYDVCACMTIGQQSLIVHAHSTVDWSNLFCTKVGQTFPYDRAPCGTTTAYGTKQGLKYLI